ncbi:MAG: class I SAM-dependent methyltransferase [Halobacteriota archaeon]|nr:class I SAM-dependent methyltransferase [Halobacteriota archaeon]
MNTKKFFETIEEVKELSSLLNPEPDKWNFLTSVEYMLSSQLYLDSIFRDLNLIESNKIVINDKQRVLDFGTGCGYLTVLLSKTYKEVYGLETFEVKSIIEHDSETCSSGFEESKKFKRNLWQYFEKKYASSRFLFYGGKKLPFKDISFDIIVAYAVIEHIRYELLTNILIELNRVLKEGGTLLIFKLPQKYSINELICRVFNIEAHTKTFSKKEIEELIIKYGFKIEKIYYSDFVFEFPPKITNFLYPFLKTADNILKKTPFKYFGHNLNIIAIKEKSYDDLQCDV